MTLFGIPTRGSDASAVKVEHNLGCATLMVNDVQSLNIEHQLRPDVQYDLDRFLVFPCYTGFTSAVQISELRIGTGRNTFAYIFPVTSFRNEMDFDKRFGLIYADAGFRKFVTTENLKRFQSSYVLDQTSVAQVPLDEVVNDSLSIFVASKEILAEHDVSADVLELRNV